MRVILLNHICLLYSALTDNSGIEMGAFVQQSFSFTFYKANTFLRRTVKTKPLQRCPTVLEIIERK